MDENTKKLLAEMASGDFNNLLLTCEKNEEGEEELLQRVDDWIAGRLDIAKTDDVLEGHNILCELFTAIYEKHCDDVQKLNEKKDNLLKKFTGRTATAYQKTTIKGSEE